MSFHETKELSFLLLSMRPHFYIAATYNFYFMVTSNSVQYTEHSMGNMKFSLPLFYGEMWKWWISILIQYLLLSFSTFYSLCAITFFPQSEQILKLLNGSVFFLRWKVLHLFLPTSFLPTEGWFSLLALSCLSFPSFPT